MTDTPETAADAPENERSFSRGQRVVLYVVGAILILAELSRFPSLLDMFRGHDMAADAGGVVSLTLSMLFAVQIFRGRWLPGAICFFTLFLTVEVWSTLQMPAAIGGMPFRYPVFLGRLPLMIVHFVGLLAILSVRCTTARRG